MSGGGAKRARCQLYSPNRKCAALPDTSAMCQKPTYALQHPALYSITSSARASSVGGKVRPKAFAVFRLISSSNLVA